MVPNRLVIFVFFLLLFQYCLSYYFGDIFLSADELVIFLVLPTFLNHVSKNKVLVLVLSYLIFKVILFFFWEQRLQATLIDLYFLLKPLVFFWSVYFLISNLRLVHLENIEKYFRYIFIATTIYGICQFTAYYLFRITLPMQGAKFFQGAESLLEDSFSLTRASSIYGHALWFAYICAFAGIFYMYRRKKIIVLLATIGVLVTFSRWALFILGLGCFAILVYRNKRQAILAMMILVPFMLLYLFVISDKIFSVYNNLWQGYNENSTKIYGMSKALELLSINPLGFGAGSFGTYVSVNSETYKLINFSPTVLTRLAGLKSGIESFTSILAVQLGLDAVIIFFYPYFKKLKWSYSGVYFFLLIIFPIVSIYTPLLLILSAFFIVYIEKRELAELNAV